MPTGSGAASTTALRRTGVASCLTAASRVVVDVLSHEHLTVGDTLQLGPWDVRILIETTATTT